MAIIKILDGGTHWTLLVKLKFACNKAILDIVNRGKDTMIFKIVRVLQDQARNTSTDLKQVL